ncbi:MAG: M15 family metallopeptidase [Spirochaetaceae bacterium]|nr:M15 family metallopeptidase [Spirochaetaceae bacterium]
MVSCQKINSNDKYVEGNIKITQKEFAETLSNLPPDVREKIIKDRAVFLSYIEWFIKISDQDKNFIFFPVDKARKLPENFNPSDLKDLDKEGFPVNKKGMQLRANTIAALKEMSSDAAANGIELLVSSAFRSYEYQKNLYNYYVGIHGKEETDKFSALPGASQHQLGTVIDFGSITLEFKDTPEGKWIKENGWKYGFSLSYPENYEKITGYNYEPWHYRYITKEGALVEKEFFNGLQYLFLNYLAEYMDFFRANVIADK